MSEDRKEAQGVADEIARAGCAAAGAVVAGPIGLVAGWLLGPTICRAGSKIILPDNDDDKDDD